MGGKIENWLWARARYRTAVWPWGVACSRRDENSETKYRATFERVARKRDQTIRGKRAAVLTFAGGVTRSGKKPLFGAFDFRLLRSWCSVPENVKFSLYSNIYILFFFFDSVERPKPTEPVWYHKEYSKKCVF